ncbi:hypothetical protein IQ07DRAFT_628077 [Pyrenochaeta sp. DS3sAY3a]|nr:hypothetical protein IQ07DRAFT_628077 [Pyrenochaeta sp. DS3sAY3a]
MSRHRKNLVRRDAKIFFVNPSCMSVKCDLCNERLKEEERICATNYWHDSLETVLQKSKAFSSAGVNPCCDDCRCISGKKGSTFHTDCVLQLRDTFAFDISSLRGVMKNLNKDVEESNEEISNKWRKLVEFIPEGEILKKAIERFPNEILDNIVENMGPSTSLFNKKNVLDAIMEEKKHPHHKLIFVSLGDMIKWISKPPRVKIRRVFEGRYLDGHKVDHGPTK